MYPSLYHTYYLYIPINFCLFYLSITLHTYEFSFILSIYLSIYLHFCACTYIYIYALSPFTSCLFLIEYKIFYSVLWVINYFPLYNTHPFFPHSRNSSRPSLIPLYSNGNCPDLLHSIFLTIQTFTTGTANAWCTGSTHPLVPSYSVSKEDDPLRQIIL